MSAVEDISTTSAIRDATADWRSSEDDDADRARLQKLQRALGWFSVGLGVAEIIAPRRVARMIGAGSRDHSLLIQLCGARELASGLALLSRRAPAKATLSRVAGDAIDLGLLGSALREPDARVGRLAAATVAVLGVTALDTYAAKQQAALSLDSGEEQTPEPITASVAVNAPPEKLYAAWKDLQQLPRFMPYLESVTPLDGRRSHWVAKGANGAVIEWDAQITQDDGNSRLGWETLPGSQYPHRGSVTFTPLGKDRGTRVFVEWIPDEASGMFATAMARLIGENPQLRITQGLRAFKQWIETGEVATTRGQSTGNRSWVGRLASRRER